LWIVFSRMIIVKEKGVSLGMDVAHSRPHRVYARAPVRAFKAFPLSLRAVARATSAVPRNAKRLRSVFQADARLRNLAPQSVDLVITSPPYLSAIDYLRGHRLSLVWMGYSVAELKALRTNNIGTENGQAIATPNRDKAVLQIARAATQGHTPSPRLQRLIERYTDDVDAVMERIACALRPGGKALFVVGNCSVGGVPVSNALIVRRAARRWGLHYGGKRERTLRSAHRYLPPPTPSARSSLRRRMKSETILRFSKPG
jgi:hypothetical protein